MSTPALRPRLAETSRDRAVFPAANGPAPRRARAPELAEKDPRARPAAREDANGKSAQYAELPPEFGEYYTPDYIADFARDYPGAPYREAEYAGGANSEEPSAASSTFRKFLYENRYVIGVILVVVALVVVIWFFTRKAAKADETDYEHERMLEEERERMEAVNILQRMTEERERENERRRKKLAEVDAEDEPAAEPAAEPATAPPPATGAPGAQEGRGEDVAADEELEEDGSEAEGSDDEGSEAEGSDSEDDGEESGEEAPLEISTPSATAASQSAPPAGAAPATKARRVAFIATPKI